MSYTLDRAGTVPEHLYSKVQPKTFFGGPTVVILDDFSISIVAFLRVVRKFLTNSRLHERDDARQRLFKYLKSLRVVKGFPKIRDGKQVPTRRLASSGVPLLRDESDPNAAVQIKHCMICAEDFVFLVHYAMTNTNLDGDTDARLAFLDKCKKGKGEANKIVL